MVTQIYPTEFQLKKANSPHTKATFLDFAIYRVFSSFKHHVYYVSINDFLKQHVYNNMLFMSLILNRVIFGMS